MPCLNFKKWIIISLNLWYFIKLLLKITAERSEQAEASLCSMSGISEWHPWQCWSSPHLGCSSQSQSAPPWPGPIRLRQESRSRAPQMRLSLRALSDCTWQHSWVPRKSFPLLAQWLHSRWAVARCWNSVRNRVYWSSFWGWPSGTFVGQPTFLEKRCVRSKNSLLNLRWIIYNYKLVLNNDNTNCRSAWLNSWKSRYLCWEARRSNPPDALLVHGLPSRHHSEPLG